MRLLESRRLLREAISVILEGGDDNEETPRSIGGRARFSNGRRTFVLWPAGAASVAAAGKVADHALIDQTGGDTFVQRRTTNGRAFDVHASLRAFGGDVTVRVGFRDGDFVDYPLAQDAVLSFSQAAGSTVGVDTRIRITKAGGSGSIVGWMSAGRLQRGALVACTTV